MSFMARLGPRLPRSLYLPFDARDVNDGDGDWRQSRRRRNKPLAVFWIYDSRKWAI